MDPIGQILAIGAGIGIIWPRMGFFSVLLGLTVQFIVGAHR